MNFKYAGFVNWADGAECFSADAEGRLTEAQVTLDHLSGQLDALLVVFEPESMATTEGLPERLEASRGRLEAFVKGAAGDAVQYTMGLVRSHFLEADLDPVGDGVPPDRSEEDWEANHSSIQGIAERIVADLNL